ncbi:hypothetical protein PV10_02520 [Exophiala mesophila]|uniref:Uncharacterized protein n=1 Tax=Exophiala mesophila TaxID=212818 RepID=A0A0D2A6X9_EXOME|nr:uncharacterized protein PV10_02520 [Exophiala mesophila]KIV94788.1 hypothetical protein PV10_02520 [Exophiala mesophila]
MAVDSDTIPAGSAGFGQKPNIVTQGSTPHSEVASIETGSDMSVNDASLSPKPSSRLSWKGGISNLLRRSGERHVTPQEVSRWSKTTTDSDISEPVKTASLIKDKGVLKKMMKNKPLGVSGPATDTSPADPAYDPVSETVGPFGDPLIIPASSTDGPEEPTSFYDDGSDESTVASPRSSIVQRASSVRVARPRIVQHCNDSGGSIGKLFAPDSTPIEEEPAMLVPTALSPSHQLRKLHTMNAETEKEIDDHIKVTSPGGRQDALDALEGKNPSFEDIANIAPEDAAIDRTEARDTIKNTVIEYPTSPETVTGTTTLPTPLGGFGSLRLHKRDRDANQVTTKSGNTPFVDGLRSNPVEVDKKLSRAISAPISQSGRRVTIRPSNLVIGRTATDSSTFRESIVSTPYPARQNSITEEDETSSQANQTSSGHGYRRARPLSDQTEVDSAEEKDDDLDISINEKPPIVPISTKPSIMPTTSRSDRFPSPVAPEILFLDLRLARHPSARVKVEVEVVDKTTFDDEQLFKLIQKTYNSKFHGLVRGLFSASKLSHASLAPSSSSSSPSSSPSIHGYSGSGYGYGYGHGDWHGQQPLTIDGADFIRHLLRPRLGHRRKVWLLWLRNQQHVHRGGRITASPRHRSRLSNDDSPADSTVSPVFSFMPSRDGGSIATSTNHNTQQHNAVHNHNENDGEVKPSVPHSNNSTTNLRNPAQAPAPGSSTQASNIAMPRMPFQTYPQRLKSTVSHSQPQTPNTASTWSNYEAVPPSRIHSHRHPHTHSHSVSHTTIDGIPTLYLHYTFCLWRVLLFLALTIIASLFTTTMWILFGLPGRGADQGDGEVVFEDKAYPLSWQRDAQGRVGTGLLLGFVVLALGCIAEGAWVWASWVLN